MGKKDGGESESKTKKIDEEKEGKNLLGKPTFKKLENGRFRCVQTGHELAANEKDSYANTKHCRLGLIDSALSRRKPPLNMFEQSPDSRSKLTCKLTGMTVNKTEEHIWKHINGKKFLAMLEQKENEEQTEDGATGEEDGAAGKDSDQKADKSSKRKRDDLKRKEKVEVVEEEEEEEEDELEIVGEDYGKVKEEEDFWMPPVGDRWDLDNGKDRWASDSDDDDDDAATDDKIAAEGIAEVEDGEEEGEPDEEKPSKRRKKKASESGSSDVGSSEKKNKNKKKKKKRKATAV